MKRTPPTLTFDLDDLTEVTDAMARFAAAHRGWINLEPDVDEDDLPPPPSPLARLFRSGAPDIAMATWMPPEREKTDAPQTVGLAHRLGNRIVPLLADLDLSCPDTWRRVQDSPRRGLVVAIPAETAHEEVLRWLMQLAVAATRATFNGQWTASVHEGRPTR